MILMQEGNPFKAAFLTTSIKPTAWMMTEISRLC